MGRFRLGTRGFAAAIVVSALILSLNVVLLALV